MPKKTETKTSFTSFVLTIDPKNPSIIPVVESLDDLTRSQRRRLRDVMSDSALQRALTNGPKFQQFIDYALAYAGTQGVAFNLDNDMLDDETYDRVRQEAVLAGINLMTHFAEKVAGDEGKAGGGAGENNEPTPK